MPAHFNATTRTFARAPSHHPKHRSRTFPLTGVRVFSLFSGTGADRVAFETLGARCVGMCEIDKAARETIKANFPIADGSSFPADVQKLHSWNTPDHDLLIATFPCQAFSISGRQKAFKDREKGRLIFDVLRVVAAKKPKVVLLENVPRFATICDGKALKRLTKEFKRLGYDFSHAVLNAADFGLPQQRKRLFMVATRIDLTTSAGKPFEFPSGKAPTRVVADILETGIAATINKTRITKSATKKPAQMNKPNRVGFVDGNKFQGARVYSADSVGITLTASSGGLGGSSGLYLINGEARQLTPRECARMQGYPEWFKPHESAAQARKQFGNAVAVPVMKAILSAIGRHLLRAEKRHVGLSHRIDQRQLTRRVRIEKPSVGLQQAIVPHQSKTGAPRLKLQPYGWERRDGREVSTERAVAREGGHIPSRGREGRDCAQGARSGLAHINICSARGTRAQAANGANAQH